ncbi:hypothetical protein PHMEG_0007365 [Phytophthora megakarya]|uniref:Reverse transcriptase n=1 Tax=Phytophthora megakarya TaxID=4795 RepID=A0A225WLI4_9STRA|nr:hypothetical protein PHMEG_0007365 [Phytophthora megakarya]
MNPSPVVEPVSYLDLTWDSDQGFNECVYYHERSDRCRRSDGGTARSSCDDEAVIEDIQLWGSENQTPEEIDQLRKGSGSSGTS